MRVITPVPHGYSSGPTTAAPRSSWQLVRMARAERREWPTRSRRSRGGSPSPRTMRVRCCCSPRHTKPPGRPDDALAAYERVIAAEPDNVIALNNAAWLHNEAGSHLALDYSRRAYEQAPDVAAVLDTYGWVLLSRGDVDAAVEHLRKAALGAPDSADIQYHFAAALARRGETPEARAVLESVLDASRTFALRQQAEALLAEL